MGNDIIITTIVSTTDVGLVRANNEDCLLISDPYTGQYLGENLQLNFPSPDNRLLLVVSDGMGGAEGGEIASRLTTSILQIELPRLPKRLSAQSRLSAAIEEANAVVRQERLVDRKLNAMGATVTAALIERNMVYIGEVGDSRAYIMRDGRLKQITTDQTMLQVMLDAGSITPSAAATSRNRNILLQAIGSQEYLQIAVNSLELRRGDLLLLCSDGLSGKLNAMEMAAIIQSNSSMTASAKALVEAAKERGGEDNITVILAKFNGEGLRPRTQETLTRSIQVLSRYDPTREAQSKAKLQTRSATLDDWMRAEVINYYAHTPEQRSRFEQLTDFGQYVVCRQGDTLTVSCEQMPDILYCLISGRYVLEVETIDGQKHSLTLLISPLDPRPDEEIQMGVDVMRVKRQFFVGSAACLGDTVRSAMMWCVDDENAMIQISQSVYLAMGEIFGDRFLTAVRYC
jgi:PPM family protein phosphatase